jgi:hypothetical protein
MAEHVLRAHHAFEPTTVVAAQIVRKLCEAVSVRAQAV